MSEAALTTPDKEAMDIATLGDEIIAKLKTVFDPEIPVNVYDLGLIYKVDVNADGADTYKVDIDMTLTTPNCPVAGQMPAMVQDAVRTADKVGLVTVNLVWEPSWDKSRMTDEARMMLNMF